MGERWLMRLPPDSEGRVIWTAPGDGARVARRDPLSQVATMAGRRVVLVVPGEEVLLTRVVPPKAGQRDLLKAVPYLLEESLSAPVEQLHFALGQRESDGGLPVAVVALRQLEEWLEPVRGAGLEPEAVLPAPLLLPLEPGAWSVLLTPEIAWVRTGACAGFGVDAANLAVALGLALSDGVVPPPERLEVWLDPERQEPPASLAALGVVVMWHRFAGDPLTVLAAHDRPGGGLDLAQGRFARAGRMGGMVRALRPTLVLLLIWLLMRGGEAGLQAFRLEQRADELDRAIQGVFRESFPEVKRIVNPKVQMTQQLESLKGGGRGTEGNKGFLSVFGRSGKALREIPESVLNGVRFGEGKLELMVRLPDLQRLDVLKQRMEGSGLAVGIQSASREGEGIAARLKVESP
ncbi:MAG: type II secretion system protein GspL [Magnetococcales bacterium]|nr:type II secretion system protein GspL [Magnetococcales bacterium]